MADFTSYKAEDFLQEDTFIQFCLGTPDAVAFWQDYISAHPAQQGEIEKALSLYHQLSVRVDAETIGAEQKKLKAAIETQHREPAVPAVLRPMINWRRIAVAAAIIVFIVLCGTWFYSKKSNTINDVSPVEFAKANYDKIIQSNADERREVTLPDGSVATLNYGTTLKISQDYNQRQRWVYLDGEAFFSVKPDKQKPFVVITSKNATSALGTSFKVRNYSNENISDVMLATGKVKVQSMLNASSATDLILLPGEKATYIGNNASAKSSFSLNVLNNWRSLKIELDQANLEQIIAVLEFNYGIEVKLQNKPQKAFAFTGKFNNESLHEVLEAISFTNKFSYSQRGNIVSVLFQ